MFPTLILSSFVGMTLPEEVVDRMVSQRVVVVERQVKLEVVAFKGDPLGSKEAGNLSVLTQPTLMLSHKQTGFMQVGEKTGQGITFRATPQLRLDGKIGLECETTITTPKVHSGIRLSSGSFIEGVSEETAKASSVVTPGKPHKVRLSAKSPTEQTWVEVTASVVEPQLANPKVEEPKRLTWTVTNALRVDPCVQPASHTTLLLPLINPTIPMVMPSLVGK